MKVTKFNPNNGDIKPQHRKEKGFYKQISLINSKFKTVITARFYATKNDVYCCIWLQDSKNQIYRGGSSRAGGGGGYDLMSQAGAFALNELGFEFDEGIAGVGQTQFESALIAISRYLKLGKTCIIIAQA